MTRILLFVLCAFVIVGAAPELLEAKDPQYRDELRRARRMLMRGQADVAVPLLEGMLKKYPYDDQVSTTYVDVLMQLERYDDADAFLEDALQNAAQKVNLYRKRVDLRKIQDRPKDAFADVLKIISLNDGLAPWAFKETRNFLEEGMNPGDARKAVEAELKEQPENKNFTVLAATILELDNKPQKATELVLEADRREKQDGRLVMRFAEELLAMDHRDRAQAAMLMAAGETQKKTRRSQYLFKLADMLEEDQNYEQALVHLETIAEERRGSASAGKALLRGANIYQTHLDDPRGALKVYRQLENDPSLGHYRPDMLLRMAECMVRLGDFDGASHVFMNVIPEAVDPEHAERAAFGMADVQFYKGDADSAMKLYQDMAEDYPRSLLTNDAANRYVLLNLYGDLNGGEAAALYGTMEWGRSVGDSSVVEESARELTAKYNDIQLGAEAWIALADLAEQHGHYALAVENLDHVVKEHSQDRRAAVALFRQGEILMRHLIQPQQALGKYEKILVDYSNSVVAGDARRLVERIRNGQS